MTRWTNTYYYDTPVAPIEPCPECGATDLEVSDDGRDRQCKRCRAEFSSMHDDGRPWHVRLAESLREDEIP